MLSFALIGLPCHVPTSEQIVMVRTMRCFFIVTGEYLRARGVERYIIQTTWTMNRGELDPL